MGTDGRKLPREYENPIDNVLIDLAHSLNVHAFRPLGFGPNTITTMSLAAAMASLAAFTARRYLLFAALFGLAYLLDCADGNYARTYNQVTDFGDAYDHAADLLKAAGLILAVVTHRMNAMTKAYFMLAFMVLGLGTLVHLGCQQRVYLSAIRSGATNGQPGQAFLSPAESFCFSPGSIVLTRYVGSGTLVAFVLVFALYMAVTKK
jgi:phosphatidylglycerophosphate synthase